MGKKIQILKPSTYGALGQGPSSARVDTEAFAKMTGIARSNPADTYKIQLDPGKTYCLGYMLNAQATEIAALFAQKKITKNEQTCYNYRCAWWLDGVTNLLEVSSPEGTSRDKWAVLKLTPADYTSLWKTLPDGSIDKPPVSLMLAGRTKGVANLTFLRVVLDGSATESNRTMDTQQSNLITCGGRGVTNLRFGGPAAKDGVVLRDVAADGVKTVNGTSKVTLQNVWAEKMGRAAIVIQGGVSDILVEDCGGDQNFKAWLDAEPTSGDAPTRIQFRRTQLHCGAPVRPDGTTRRAQYAASFAGENPGKCMSEAIVEDCSVDSGLWMYNVESIEFRRCKFATLFPVPGPFQAIRMEERVFAEFWDCDIEAVDLALFATHHKSMGNIPSKMWFHGGVWNVRDRAGTLDSAQGLWIDNVTINRREPKGAVFVITGTLPKQDLTGFCFTSVKYDQNFPLAEIVARDTADGVDIHYRGISATGCGPNPFKLRGRIGNIETPVIEP